MTLRRAVCASGAAVLTVVALAACASQPSYEQMRPDPSSVVAGDRGLQSKDLIEMTDKMAPDMLKIPEIAANSNKVIIVMTGITNKTSEPTRDMTIYTARLRSLLNQHARDRLAFVENRQTTEALQNQELGTQDPFEQGSRTGQPANTRLLPQYALKGEFYEMRNSATSYYLCTFQLTNLRTGELVWENSYETRTLNF
jgi:PBP1b-binding outer membrane lipoprotein LpoB